MKRKTTLRSWLAMTLVLFVGEYCVAQATELASQKASEPGLSTSSIIVIQQAKIKCIYKLSIPAQTDGIISSMLVDEGSIVKKGDVLLTIDDRLAMAELNVANKELEAAKIQAKQVAHITYAKKAAELASYEYSELKKLWDEKRAVAYFEVRKKMLEYDRAEASKEVAEVDHAKDQSAAAVAEEKLNAAKVQLDLRRVVAPYNGVIVERLRSQGEWLKAGEPVLKFLNMDEMRVEVRVPVENRSVQQLQNATMKVRIPIGQDREIPFETKVEFVNYEIELGECRVWANSPNQMVGNSWILRDGMEGTVEIHLGSGSALNAGQ